MSRRKAEMVLELVDRATRPMRKFMSVQKRMDTQTKTSNRSAARSAGIATRATNLYKRAVNGLQSAQTGLQNGIRRSNRFIDTQARKLRNSAGLMKSGILGVGGAAVVAGGLMTAYAGTTALVAASFLGPARQFEKFQSILKVTEGSMQGAQDAMKWVEDFAVKTPYELDQVMDSFVKLRAYGLDPTNGLLQTLGDTSAAMGKPIVQAVEAIADAVTGENERLKEFGVKAAKVGKYFEYSYTLNGETKVVKALASDRAAIESALTGIFKTKYGGAMNDLALTFDGMWSNIMDQWGKFQRMVMGTGVFDWMKDKLSTVLDTINAMEKSGALEAWAKTISDNILTGLNAIWDFGVGAIRFWKDLKPWIIAAKDALGGWRNMALALLAIPLRGVIISLGIAMLQLAWGAGLAATSLAGIGFGAIAGGALRMGSVLLGLLNPLAWVRGAFVALRVAFIATGIGALVAGLAMAGVWVYNNWSGLKSFFVGFGQAFMAALGPAGPLVEWIIGGIQKLWGWITQLIGPVDASSATWSAWGQSVGAIVGAVVAAIIAFPGQVISMLQTGWSVFATWVAGMWSGLQSSATIAWGGLKTLLLSYTPHGLIYTHWDGITAHFQTLWDGVAGVFQNAWAFIDSTVLAPMRKAVSFMTDNAITRGVGGIYNKITGNTSATVPIDGAKAKGGLVSKGLTYLVGERGPEIFTPRTSGQIIPNHKAFGAARKATAAAAIAAGSMALPAAAANDPARYIQGGSSGGITLNAPLTLNIEGSVDASTLQALEPRLAAQKEEIADMLEEAAHLLARRGHN